MLRRLAALGILNDAAARSHWKIYLTGDLVDSSCNGVPIDRPLAPSAALPPLDREAIEATLDTLLNELERANERVPVPPGATARRRGGQEASLR